MEYCSCRRDEKDRNDAHELAMTTMSVYNRFIQEPRGLRPDARTVDNVDGRALRLPQKRYDYMDSRLGLKR